MRKTYATMVPNSHSKIIIVQGAKQVETRLLPIILKVRLRIWLYSQFLIWLTFPLNKCEECDISHTVKMLEMASNKL